MPDATNLDDDNAPEWWADIPKSVRVGYRTMQMVLTNEWDTLNTNRMGECDYGEGEIRLARFLDRQKAANVLIHEILHTIGSVWRMPSKKLTEERVVGVFASGLSSVVQDNPSLFQWLYTSLQSR